MKAPCTSCGRPFVVGDRYSRCPGCRNRAKVYQHQLHRRRGVAGFEDHDCSLCRKYRAHVRAVRARWDRRGVYRWVTCKTGHSYFREGGHECPVCARKKATNYLNSIQEGGR